MKRQARYHGFGIDSAPGFGHEFALKSFLNTETS